MTEQPLTVAGRPTKPLLLFDGECNFCCFWIRRWQRITGDRVDYLPFQDPSVAIRFPELPRSRLERAVQLIEPHGCVLSGAAAVFRSLASNHAWRWPLALYLTIPPAAALSEWAYTLVARNRTTFSLLTRLLWGRNPEPSSYQLVRWLFLRLVGIIYLFAFVSLWVQVDGLIGRDGILPAAEYMTSAQRYFDGPGASIARWHALPTLCWINASNSFLHGLCATGTAAAILLTLGYAPPFCAALLWTLYLSLSVVGREFLSFQWDALLLETGLLCILFFPVELVSRWRAGPRVSRVGLWLLRWLLFRLMLESGLVKLLSGDLTWRRLTALNYHYETQPLPTWLAWYLHQLPAAFHQACVGAMFGIELALPFLIFGPRRLRFAAGAGFLILQICILLTGNYGFFNYLTIALCLVLFDDAALLRLLPARWRTGLDAKEEPRPTWPLWTSLSVAVVTLMATAPQLPGSAGWVPAWLRPAQAISDWLAPFRSFNRYGLFAVMTTSRPEIVVEGSNDRRTWLPYSFKYKPGPLNRRPAFVAPHQPRLDWQMWFAALGTPQQNPWFIQFSVRLLQGSPDVLRLLEGNPFPDAPPNYIRAVVYEYHFTGRGKGQPTDWWRREAMGTYLPPISDR